MGFLKRFTVRQRVPSCDMRRRNCSRMEQLTLFCGIEIAYYNAVYIDNRIDG